MSEEERDQSTGYDPDHHHFDDPRHARQVRYVAVAVVVSAAAILFAWSNLLPQQIEGFSLFRDDEIAEWKALDDGSAGEIESVKGTLQNIRDRVKNITVDATEYFVEAREEEKKLEETREAVDLLRQKLEEKANETSE